MITVPLQALGRRGISGLRYLGQLGMLLGATVESLIHGKARVHLTLRQIVVIGFGSQLVVIVTGAFTGAVFTAQTYFKFKDFGIESTVGAIVSVAMSRELAPVLAGLMVTGRMGASMAAEIGTMKVTEQIDALRAMGVHPVDYLIRPRLIAMMVSIPLLIAESIAFGIGASYIVSVWAFEVPGADWWKHLGHHTGISDVLIGMTKGFVFGILIVVISCHQGLTAKDGAVGVGRGTTRAVVNSSLAILIFNFFLTFLLNYFSPIGEAM